MELDTKSRKCNLKLYANYYDFRCFRPLNDITMLFTYMYKEKKGEKREEKKF